MTLLTLLLALVGLSLLAYLVQRAPVIEDSFKPIIVFVLVIVAIYVVGLFFGVWAAVAGIHPSRG